MISVKDFCAGMMSTNTYVITDSATGFIAVVDPACEDSRLTKCLLDAGKDNIKYILLTHGHFDHIGAALYYARAFDAEIVISKEEKSFLSDKSLNLSCMFYGLDLEAFDADLYLGDSDVVSLGETQIKFLLTPGHTSGSGCFICEEDKIIFSGDTLFYCSMGRTDFPTGNAHEMRDSLKKLCGLSGDYRVYPGHDRATTLSFERENNPYIH